MERRNPSFVLRSSERKKGRFLRKDVENTRHTEISIITEKSANNV